MITNGGGGRSGAKVVASVVDDHRRGVQHTTTRDDDDNDIEELTIYDFFDCGEWDNDEDIGHIEGVKIADDNDGTAKSGAGESSGSADFSPGGQHHIRGDNGGSAISFVVSDSARFDEIMSDPRPDEAPQNEPHGVYAVWSNDLNIDIIHDAIRQRYAYQLVHANEVRAMALARIETIAATPELFAEALAKYRVEQMRIRAADAAERLVGWRLYVNECSDFLKEYLAIKGRGGGVGGEEIRNTRRILIECYLAYASKHIEIVATSNVEDVIRCVVCGEVSDAKDRPAENGRIVCSCGRESIAIAQLSLFRDTARVDNATRATYDDLTTFIRRLDAFEGRQRTKPPEPLYRILEEYLDAHKPSGAPTVAETRALPNPTDGRKKPGSSVAMLAEALRATSNSSFYRDIDLIGHRIWGWPLADLSVNGLRAQLIEDYVATQRVYEVVKTRGSSLNVNIRLATHLRARGYKCMLSDFKIVTGKESLQYHEQCLSRMFQQCGLQYHSLIDSGGAKDERGGGGVVETESS